MEEPERGDIARHTVKDRPDADSLFFLSFNANKRSLTLNLKHARGQDVFRDLLKTADVLLENFGPGVIERLGFGYPVLRAGRRWRPSPPRSSARAERASAPP